MRCGRALLTLRVLHSTSPSFFFSASPSQVGKDVVNNTICLLRVKREKREEVGMSQDRAECGLLRDGKGGESGGERHSEEKTVTALDAIQEKQYPIQTTEKKGKKIQTTTRLLASSCSPFFFVASLLLFAGTD